MDSISLIIPYLEVDEDKKTVLNRMLESVKGQYDELLLMTNKTDCLAKEINKGIAQSTGDFIIVSNDDVQLIDGNLRDLADPKAVTVPRIMGSIDKLFHGQMWCMPRSIYEDVGPIWEGYDGFYYDDSDYWMSIEAKGYPIVKREDIVLLHSHPARTLSKLKKDGREETNRQRFIERWGSNALFKIE